LPKIGENRIVDLINKMSKTTKPQQKRALKYLFIANLVLAIFALSFSMSSISAANANLFNVCCEKTKKGAWCQNTLEENCDAGYRKTPTSCEATSFCKQGCCYDSQEGLCMENTPQKVCNDNNGTWADDESCNIPQCNLGCCVLGTQASFVTLTRCKRLSGLYGLQTNFRNDIADEMTCIAVASSGDEGACVYTVDFQKTCRFTSRGECTASSKKAGNSTSEFFAGYLCSAEELGTNCGPSEKTTCIEGKDEVYFVDTCGNPANIYDSSKIKDKSYWQKKVDKSKACGAGNIKGSAESKTCGNCDYFHGSICRRGDATYGNYKCSDLNCYNTQNGKDYKNGESWCIYDGNVGGGVDAVGSRHFRHVCIYGEETIEPCADYRGEICIQADIKSEGETFTEAACRVNRFTDCIDQAEKEDCLNTDKRDCYWLEGVQFLGLASSSSSNTSGSTGSAIFGGGKTGGFGGGVTGSVVDSGVEEENNAQITGNAVAPITGDAVSPITGEAIAPITGYGLFGGDKDEKKVGSGVQLGGGACLPLVPKGLKFWEDGEASGFCNLGNSKCVVTYDKKLIGEKKCVENCQCLEEGYAQKMNEVCTSLGDCGAYVNIAGKYTDDGAQWKIKGKTQTITQGIMEDAKKRAGVKPMIQTQGFGTQKPNIWEGVINYLVQKS
jgi:hypothetical protein